MTTHYDVQNESNNLLGFQFDTPEEAEETRARSYAPADLKVVKVTVEPVETPPAELTALVKYLNTEGSADRWIGASVYGWKITARNGDYVVVKS